MDNNTKKIMSDELLIIDGDRRDVGLSNDMGETVPKYKTKPAIIEVKH